MSYRIIYSEVVRKKHIPSLPPRVKRLVSSAIEERLMLDPIGLGKPLRYSLRGCRRFRVSDYRILYKVDVEASTVFIIGIGHRKNVYEDMH